MLTLSLFWMGVARADDPAVLRPLFAVVTSAGAACPSAERECGVERLAELCVCVCVCVLSVLHAGPFLQLAVGQEAGPMPSRKRTTATFHFLCQTGVTSN